MDDDDDDGGRLVIEPGGLAMMHCATELQAAIRRLRAAGNVQQVEWAVALLMAGVVEMLDAGFGDDAIAAAIAGGHAEAARLELERHRDDPIGPDDSLVLERANDNAAVPR